MRTCLIGKKFTRLSPQECLKKNGRIYWLCICDCGKYKEVSAGNLCSGEVKSCGCLKLEVSGLKHGHGRARDESSEHKSWRAMRARCLNPKDKAYRYYGGRGIEIHSAWSHRDGFIQFLSDMGLKPSPAYTLERRDVNGNYCPENCYWATRREQRANQRPHVMSEESRRKIGAANTRVKPERALVIRLLLNCRLSQHKIASLLNISQGAVSHVSRRLHYNDI